MKLYELCCLRLSFLLGLVAGNLAVAAGATVLPDGFTEALVANGIPSATAMEFAPDGRLFVCQQDGALRVIKNGALLATPFVQRSVNSLGERGLLGVTFHPNFPSTPYVYVYYTLPGSPPHNRVSRFTANGDVALPGSEIVVFELNDLNASNHNGGAIHFAPDGTLFIAAGDNAVSSNSQTLDNLLGKILRINGDGSIPNTNPFFSAATGDNRAIWALGLRNPFTFAFQPGTGRMFINDVGETTWEEINEGLRAGNYGWPQCEGDCPPPNSNFVDPLYFYPHGSQGGCAITGGAFYNPPVMQFPGQYEGVYFFADYCNGWIRYLDPDNGSTVTAFASGLSSVVDLKVSTDGALYVLDRGRSGVFRIEFNGAPAITAHPQSQTVNVGEPATFTVVASGTPPLAYQWQRNNGNISGATASIYTVQAAAPSDDGAQFRCIVGNIFGTAVSNPATLTVDNNQSPVPVISSPINGSHYSAGDIITFVGSASDQEDGSLPASAFSWMIEFHHDDHVHPFLGPMEDITSAPFQIPTTGETSANVFYRINLTVTDSGGRQASTFVDILPRVVVITLQTSPPGLKLSLDGQPVTTPLAFDSVVGMSRTLGAISPQSGYRFSSWSDGGAAIHSITTPALNTTYAAFFKKKGKL